MWDDEALYIGLRCLDRKQANPAPLPRDATTATRSSSTSTPGRATRSGARTGRPARSTSSTRRSRGRRSSRGWVMRQGIATSGTVLKGVEIAATRDAGRLRGRVQAPLGELPRASRRSSARCWRSTPSSAAATARGGPTGRSPTARRCRSSSRPRSARSSWSGRSTPTTSPPSGPAAFPFWVETPWVQPERAQVQAVVAIPPGVRRGRRPGRGPDPRHRRPGRQDAPRAGRAVRPAGPGVPPRRGVAGRSTTSPPSTYFATARVVARTGQDAGDRRPPDGPRGEHDRAVERIRRRGGRGVAGVAPDRPMAFRPPAYNA